jgi:hypothetical protein
MRRLPLFLLVLIVSVSGQWIAGEDVSNTNGNYFTASNTDSVFWDEDTLYICGAETAYIFIRVGKTLGMITYKGAVTTKDTMAHASDSARVVFEIAMLEGMIYTALDANVTETYYNMASINIAITATGTFYFYPFQNTNLDQLHTNYYLLRIRGLYSTNLSEIWLKEERIFAY